MKQKGVWGGKKIKRENEIQKWKEKKKKVWVDERERDEGRLQSEGVVQLEGTLGKIETETKDKS